MHILIFFPNYGEENPDFAKMLYLLNDAIQKIPKFRRSRIVKNLGLWDRPHPEKAGGDGKTIKT